MSQAVYTFSISTGGTGKRVKAISVRGDKELAKRLEQAKRAGLSASFKRVK